MSEKASFRKKFTSVMTRVKRQIIGLTLGTELGADFEVCKKLGTIIGA
jgi:hypothetical protein